MDSTSDGVCPNCGRACALDANECASCKAIFDGAAWKPRPRQPGEVLVPPIVAKQPGKEPIPAKKHGPVFWIFSALGAGAALFVVSGIVAGRLEQRQEETLKAQAASLATVPTLQAMVVSGMRQDRRPPLVCWYIGAIGYRLAEARDLKIEKLDAIRLANDEYLVRELASNGFNTLNVIGGVAVAVYGSPLSPRDTFQSQVTACSRSRP